MPWKERFGVPYVLGRNLLPTICFPPQASELITGRAHGAQTFSLCSWSYVNSGEMSQASSFLLGPLVGSVFCACSHLSASWSLTHTHSNIHTYKLIHTHVLMYTLGHEVSILTVSKYSMGSHTKTSQILEQTFHYLNDQDVEWNFSLTHQFTWENCIHSFKQTILRRDAQLLSQSNN